MQGYNGKYSHKNKFALDFRLRKGKSVCAARSGKVIKMVEHNNEGGGNIKFVSKANYVVIDHGDGTYAGYWHLEQNGALVEVGDLVKVGDKIGKSGSTGFSTMAHLHFMVYSYDKNGKKYTVPTFFKTNRKPAKRLRSYSLVKSPRDSK
jgi:murein DD-endopeptidase MepM/ murein hydrolase activator NlpD